MKIILDIPDDIVEDQKERNLRLFAGIDLIAYKNRGGEWMVKTRGCSMCGECCRNLPKEHPFPTIDGKCIYLINPPGYGDKWICALGINRPFGCGMEDTSFIKGCTVKYKKMKE